jgi:Ca-activated chloride channel family protein
MKEGWNRILELLGEQNLELGYPWILWLLPIPLLVYLLPALKYRAEALYYPLFGKILSFKGEKASRGVRAARQNVFQGLLMWLVWGLVLLALASPQLIGEPEKKVKTARSLLLNVDLSLSMDSRDWVSEEGERVSRWDAVKEVLAEFVERRQGDRMGLVLFGSQAYLQAPFTSDLDVILQLLNESEIGMAGAKTVIGNAIGKGIDLFQRDSIEEKVMILLTDGADSGSELPPLQAARLAGRDSITIYAIGIGSPATGMYELDEPALTAIAEATGGEYFRASDRERLLEIYEILDELEPIEFEDEDYIPRRMLFYLPLLPAFVLTLLYHLVAGIITLLRLFQRSASEKSPSAP